MPRLDRAWIDEFTMQMTIQHADADEIDKALADVHAHCMDSGQTAFEAFGDPKSYATKLAAELPPKPRQRWIDPWRIGMLLPLVLGLAILQIPFWAPEGDEVPVSVGQVLLVAVAVPAWVVLTAPWFRRRARDPRTPERPAFDENGWRPLLLTLGLAALGAALWLTFDRTLFTASKWGLIGLGLALFVAGVVLTRLIRPRRTSRA